MKAFIPLDMADSTIVTVRTTNQCAPTPHCNNHGAMNKITRNEDGGGIWRCISVHSITIVKVGNSIGKKENDCVCRAGCMEVRPYNHPLYSGYQTNLK